jgi:hypothetical protein
MCGWPLVIQGKMGSNVQRQAVALSAGAAGRNERQTRRLIRIRDNRCLDVLKYEALQEARGRTVYPGRNRDGDGVLRRR